MASIGHRLPTCTTALFTHMLSKRLMPDLKQAIKNGAYSLHISAISEEEKSMTFIWYEVFPVTLASQHTVLIRQHQEPKFPAWMIPNLPNSHPNDIVVRHLVSFFGDGFDSCQMIIHSTSWRYEPECDQLLLTYIAVL